MRWQELRTEWARDPKRRAALLHEFPHRKLSDEIVALRVRYELTQAELATRMRTSQSVVARLESGKHAVTLKTLDRLAQALGVEWKIVFEAIETPATADIPVSTMVIAQPDPSARLPWPAIRQAARPGNKSYALAA